MAQQSRGLPLGSCLHRSFLSRDSPIPPLNDAHPVADRLLRGESAPIAIDRKRQNGRRPSIEDVE
jgi:hypothetical protein